MAKESTGTLIIIGGHEDKNHDQVILKEVARHATGGQGKLVIATVATQLPEEVAQEYVEVFEKLGVKKIDHFDIRTRQDAYLDANAEILKDASVVFFTGGDQLRITSQLGDSPLYTLISDLYERGATIAGTSAGASVMSETMMITGPQEESHRLGAVNMAPGFGLIKGVVVDQHFAERGRIGRLLGAVAQNPRQLGVGIDENTAIVVHEGSFEVIGEGGVYVVDGSQISASNLSEGESDEVLSCFDIRLHVLKAGDRFNLETRRPANNALEEVPAIDAAHDGHRAAAITR